jgi:adenine-specific DNA-methyltransferase
MAKKPAPKAVEALTHTDDTRKNIPTAEYQPVVTQKQREDVRVEIERRDRDLDPQFVWRGKGDDENLVVNAPPIFIQEKVQPRALIDDLLRQTADAKPKGAELGHVAPVREAQIRARRGEGD